MVLFFFCRGRQVVEWKPQGATESLTAPLSLLCHWLWGKKGKGLAHLSCTLSFPKAQGQGMVEARLFVLEATYIKCCDLLSVVIAACYLSGTVNCNVQIRFSVMEECRMWPFIFKFEEIIKANLLWFSPCSNYNTEHFKCSYCQIYLHVQCKLK